MKSKFTFIILALCAMGACASLTGCMTDNSGGEDENSGKAKTNTTIVEQQKEDEKNCPDGECPEDEQKAPEAMPDFRFAPPPEHMPEPTSDEDEGEKKPMPAPHRRGGAKPKMPKPEN